MLHITDATFQVLLTSLTSVVATCWCVLSLRDTGYYCTMIHMKLRTVLLRRSRETQSLVSNRSSLLRSSVIEHNVHSWTPSLKFMSPIRKRGQRCNDQLSTVHPAAREMREKRDHLNRFSQSHLVRQNTRHTITHQCIQPLRSFQLI